MNEDEIIDSFLDEYRRDLEKGEADPIVTENGSVVSKGVVIAISISAAAILVLGLFLSGIIQSLAAKFITSGYCPQSMKKLLHRIATLGSLAHRKSRRYVLRTSHGVFYPETLIEHLFLYHSVYIDGNFYELYDWDVRTTALTIECGITKGTCTLVDIEEGRYIFQDDEHPEIQFVVTLPDERQVREQRYISKL